MAGNIPESLRVGDIGRFAIRAAQVEQPKPVVAYWCNFWIVNQIIEKGLHLSDDEIKAYTMNLVDKLEQFKVQHADDETVTDSVAANAYVEQFGMEVFNRAEATMNANKVTKQTADTLQAAATFLELCHIWNNPPEPEVAAKIKFAKYHALRIIKALRAGEDPNTSNPVPENEEGQISVDPELEQGDANMQEAQEAADKQRQPSVEEVPDEFDKVAGQMARRSLLDESLHPSRSPSAPPHIPDMKSPSMSSPAPVPHEESTGMDTEESTELTLPSAPETIVPPPAIFHLPSTPGMPSLSNPSKPSDSFQSFPPPSMIPPPSPPAHSVDPDSFYGVPAAPTAQNPKISPGAAPDMPSHVLEPARPTVSLARGMSQTSQMNLQEVDDQAIGLAQKHARWAVSALTFDDVQTAIKELRNALRHLGAE